MGRLGQNGRSPRPWATLAAHEVGLLLHQTDRRSSEHVEGLLLDCRLEAAPPSWVQWLRSRALGGLALD